VSEYSPKREVLSLELKNPEERDEWLQALQEHIEFVALKEEDEEGGGSLV
jgi:hypothetical protein